MSEAELSVEGEPNYWYKTEGNYEVNTECEPVIHTGKVGRALCNTARFGA